MNVFDGAFPGISPFSWDFDEFLGLQRVPLMLDAAVTEQVRENRQMNGRPNGSADSQVVELRRSNELREERTEPHSRNMENSLGGVDSGVDRLSDNRSLATESSRSGVMVGTLVRSSRSRRRRQVRNRPRTLEGVTSDPTTETQGAQISQRSAENTETSESTRSVGVAEQGVDQAMIDERNRQWEELRRRFQRRDG